MCSVFDSSGPMIFLDSNLDDSFKWDFLAFMNSNVVNYILTFLCPTIHYTQSSVAKIPMLEIPNLEHLSQECVKISKRDWDAYETSWDFQENPLVRISKGLWDVTATGAAMQYYYGCKPKVNCSLELCYLLWQGECNKNFETLKLNEQEINTAFLNIYNLQDIIESEVDEKDVTIRRADLARDIRNLLSYAVGCMFGRYSLDEKGISFAGGEWRTEKYRTFKPDTDNCIPITDEEYFDDDLVGMFCDWLKTVFGSEDLEANLDYIANALGNKGTTSRDVIRNYFLNDFFKDHCVNYSVSVSGKRPIYWLLDSGKNNGFKCLVYMHRWNEDTLGRIRSDYLRKSQEAIEAALKNAEYTIQNSTSAIDKATATKKRDKYIKQLSEIRTYFQGLSHLALQRIDIDLDDGVKVNYEKFQNIEIVDENGKKQKINLLAKI